MDRVTHAEKSFSLHGNEWLVATIEAMWFLRKSTEFEIGSTWGDYISAPRTYGAKDC